MDEQLPEEAFASLEVAVTFAWEAYHRADWVSSFARWSRVSEIWPDYAPPYVHAATSLDGLGRYSEAKSLLALGAEKFPEDRQLVYEYVTFLLRRDGYAEAFRYFDATPRHFTENGHMVRALLYAAIERNDHETVQRLGAGLSRWHPDLFRQTPDLREALLRAELHSSSAVLHNQDDLSRQIAAGDDSEDTKLMLRFESLGENCEFGLTQRHFGAEPLGLFRWTATGIDHLTKALNDQLDGIGDEANTNVLIIGDEYMTADRRYGMGSHSFIKINPEKQEKIEASLLLRLKYLRRRLIEDLEAGKKILVYHCEKRSTPEELSALLQALRRYGSSHLLYVEPEDDSHPAGTLNALPDGLMRGYIERLGPLRLPEGDRWEISFDTWLSLCRQAALEVQTYS